MCHKWLFDWSLSTNNHVLFHLGSEAAAATKTEFTAVSFPDEFKASLPFIVLINEHTTGAILFMGRLCSPLTKNGLVNINSGPYCGGNSPPGSGQSD